MTSPLDIGGILIALIAGGSAIASNRAASRASVINTEASGRMKAEEEAYERARDFDTRTIELQRAELDRVRTENQRLQQENEALRHRILRLESERDPEDDPPH